MLASLCKNGKSCGMLHCLYVAVFVGMLLLLWSFQTRIECRIYVRIDCIHPHKKKKTNKLERKESRLQKSPLSRIGRGYVRSLEISNVIPTTPCWYFISSPRASYIVVSCKNNNAAISYSEKYHLPFTLVGKTLRQNQMEKTHDHNISQLQKQKICCWHLLTPSFRITFELQTFLKAKAP